MTIELTDPNPVECARQIRTPQARLDFLPETQEVRDGDWSVAPAPTALRDRRVEMTGPTRELVSRLLVQEARRLRSEVEPDHYERYYERARDLIAEAQPIDA